MSNPAGKPKSIVVEVGPITHYGRTDAERKQMERRTLRDIEGLVRDYVRVGPRSKVVRARIEEET